MIVILGMGVVLYQGNRIFGIDFSGGDVVTLRYHERLDVPKSGGRRPPRLGEVNVNYESALGGGGEELKYETPAGKSGRSLMPALQKKYPSGGYTKVGRTMWAPPSAGKSCLTLRLAVGVSMLTILVYIAFRFASDWLLA